MFSPFLSISASNSLIGSAPSLSGSSTRSYRLGRELSSTCSGEHSRKQTRDQRSEALPRPRPPCARAGGWLQRCQTDTGPISRGPGRFHTVTNRHGQIIRYHRQGALTLVANVAAPIRLVHAIWSIHPRAIRPSCTSHP